MCRRIALIFHLARCWCPAALQKRLGASAQSPETGNWREVFFSSSLKMKLVPLVLGVFQSGPHPRRTFAHVPPCLGGGYVSKSSVGFKCIGGGSVSKSSVAFTGSSKGDTGS